MSERQKMIEIFQSKNHGPIGFNSWIIAKVGTDSCLPHQGCQWQNTAQSSSNVSSTGCPLTRSRFGTTNKGNFFMLLHLGQNGFYFDLE